ERYTERARRTIFFARYEASNYGSPYIETEHLLLGFLREDKRIPRVGELEELVRKRVEKSTAIREKVSTSVDLPLANDAKRVLAYAAEEAARLSHKHIGTEHLLLGMLRESDCFAATILREAGFSLDTARDWSNSVAPHADERGRLGGTHSRFQTVVEFVLGGQIIAGANPEHGVIPMVGERVLLQDREEKSESYRVKNVTHLYQEIPYEGEMPEYRVTKVIIDLQPE
ncbi:MAG TPA: Clp protease N-terminal domain-containing protein, partial [Terriglobales bacterium]